MKKIILAIAVTISVPAIPFPVSSAVKTVEEPAGDAKQKEEYEKSMEERLGKLGKEMDGYVQILGGLKADEDVVVEGNFLLKSELLKSKLGAGCAE